MGLSRRQFTKEFKWAAIRRLEQGVSMAEVARGMEVNPNGFLGNGLQTFSRNQRQEFQRRAGRVLLTAFPLTNRIFRYV